MSRNKKKFPVHRETPRRRLGLVITLSTAWGMILGAAGTYYFTGGPKQTAAPAPANTAPAQPLAAGVQQFTPAPQPPGEPPPGKVWSPEHGHWHDAPAVTTSASTPATPGTITVTPTTTVTPAPPPVPDIPFVTPAPK